MAEIKKTVAVKPVAKAEPAKAAQEVKPVADAKAKAPEKKEEVKVEAKAEEKDPVKKEVKVEAKAETKPAAKKTTAKKATTTKKTTTAKKTEAKPAAKKTTKKAAKQVINLQFGGKSYSVEDLQKIAGDVWKYDLHKTDEEYTSLELYVKPEESIAYYVFNGDITGSFFI